MNPHNADTAGTGAQGPTTGHARLRRVTQAAMLGETLQLANYSAVTQAAVVMALAYMFRDAGPQGYMSGLACAVTALCAATLVTTRLYRATFKGAASEKAVQRGFAVSKLLALGLGVSWGTMPAVLLPTMDNAYRVILVGVCAGLISDAYVVGPIYAVAVLLTAPVIVGLLVGLSGCEAPVGTYIAVLLAIYAAFVYASAWRMCRLSYERFWDRAVVQDQSQTIGLLLKDFEEGASDWLWETDAAGRLNHSRRRFAKLLGKDPGEMDQVSALTLFRVLAPDGPDKGDIDAVIAAIRDKAPFRDMTVGLRTKDGVRWWTLNGKPAFDESGGFLGYRGVGSDVTADRAAKARISYLAGHDNLTGLPNRAAFQGAMSALCAEARSTERPGALFYLDLDGFKAVNDTRGHLVGDRLLAEVAGRLAALSGGHGAFRLGGDEFAMVVRDLGRAGTEGLASKVVTEIARPYLVGGDMLEVGVSVGVAYVPEDAVEPSALLARADLALYAAKAEGKGRWRAFVPAMEDKALRHRSLDADMRAALAADAMELHYQPLVDMRSGRVAGFEALLRWNRPGEGWVSPARSSPSPRRPASSSISGAGRSAGPAPTRSHGPACGSRSTSRPSTCACRPSTRRSPRYSARPAWSRAGWRSRSPSRCCSTMATRSWPTSTGCAPRGCASRSTTSGPAIPA